jgi:GT2 family glycosyltransferase
VAAVGTVIVTHDSEKFIERAVDRLLAGTEVPDRVVIVDSGSADTSRVEHIASSHHEVELIALEHNVGFCAANNIGLDALGDLERVLFLNPDAFVTPDFVRGAMAVLDADSMIGAMNPKLLGAEPERGNPTGLIDCAGVFQTAIGKVYDRGQGEPDRGQFDHGLEDVPALCAAAMLCRRDALQSVAKGSEVFDERFFMYKEDVDLSYRLARVGWRTVYDSRLVVHHCRGWDRKAMPRWARRRSLANEWRMWIKGSVPARLRAPMLGYLLIKSIAVTAGR